MQSCKDIPAVKDMLATAQKVLGYDLLKLCLEGPKEKLDDTTYRCAALSSMPLSTSKGSFCTKRIKTYPFLVHVYAASSFGEVKRLPVDLILE